MKFLNFKTPSGPSTGKALLNHTIFSLSQTGETVPLRERKGSHSCPWFECNLLIVYKVNGAIKQKKRRNSTAMEDYGGYT
jgi:hypothetical protein